MRVHEMTVYIHEMTAVCPPGRAFNFQVLPTREEIPRWLVARACVDVDDITNK